MRGLNRSRPRVSVMAPYAFYFNEPPPGVDASGSHRVGQHALLYVGIAPSRFQRTDERGAGRT